MFYSILITGGDSQSRKEKAFFLYSQLNHLEPTTQKIENEVDFLIVEPETNLLGIGEIRQLKIKLSQKPFQREFKAAFIPQAEKLTLTAQNALLKILEEPPPKTFIILATPTQEHLLPTIQSRCQIINLKNQALSLSLEEQKQMLQFLNQLKKLKRGERFLSLEPYLKNRQEALDFCQKAIISLRPLLLKPPLAYSFNFDSAELNKMLNSLFIAQRQLQQNLNPKLVLENFLLNTFEVSIS